MKVKKYKVATICILLSLTLIYFGNFSFLLHKPDDDSKNQVNHENVYNMLKTSLAEDWNVTWDKGDSEQGWGIDVDDITGDVYVTGYNGTTNDDVILIKYNHEGKQQWNTTWDNGNHELGYDVKFDSNGYIYVAGANGTGGMNFDVLLLKFNGSGKFEWKRTWNNWSSDGAWALEIDSEDNIYLTGESFRTSSRAILLLKYNSSGYLLWNSTFDQPNDQYGRDIVLDSLNNIYVVGHTTPTSNVDLLVVKFDNFGNHIWNRTWGGIYEDAGWAIALDSNDNVYATGFTTPSVIPGIRDIIVVKYNKEGNLLWNRTWGTAENEEAYGIAIDSADKVYIGGLSGTITINISLVKYDSTGNFIWHKNWVRNPSYKHYCKSLIIDSSDKIYITGYWGISSPFDLFAAKFLIESPGAFILSSDAGTPDPDGNFTLSWTPSPRANNYSLYQHSVYITEINDSLTLLEEETEDLSLPLTGYSNGTYYFKGVAFNNYGNVTSNYVSVNIEIPPEEPELDLDGDDGGNGRPIPGYNLIFLIVIIGFVSTIIIYRRLKLK